MRFLSQATAKGSMLSPSAAFSLTAHLVLAGAAVYGTGVRSSELEERASERVYFLPPPDRRVASARAEERLQFMDVGSGMGERGTPSDRAQLSGAPRQVEEPRAGGVAGAAATTSEAAALVTSPDSVYSILEVDESAARVEGSAAPAYPAALLKAGTEGAVSTRYVIDSTGRTDPLSIEVLRSTDPAFTQSVREALLGMRFSPAMVHGRHVRQLVEQRFDFRIFIPPPVIADHTRATPPA